MQEKGPQHNKEDVSAETIVPELNKNGFVVLEANNSFLGRFGKFFADKIEPATRRVAIPASVVLLAVTIAACSQEKASVNDTQTSNLPAATITSDIAEPEAIRSSNPPTRIIENSANLPEELSIPKNTSVLIGSCASDGECHPYNFYWAPTKEIVLQSGQHENKLLHEACHAHQHWSINGGKPLEPSDYDLESWYLTDEGQSFIEAVDGLSWPWTQSAVNDLEDFAWTCGYFYFDPHYLQDLSPERYKWAVKNLP